MDEGLKKQAQEWFERGSHDVEAAESLYEAHGHTDVIAYLVQQAAEKHLKGYLVSRGESPPRIHELDALLKLVAKSAPDLYEPFIEFCERATKYYLDDRYPPGLPPDYTPEEIKADLDAARELLQIVREKAGV